MTNLPEAFNFTILSRTPDGRVFANMSSIPVMNPSVTKALVI